MRNPPPAQPIQGLTDGIAVLTRLAVSRTPVAVTSLARELGFEVTRTNRLLRTLAHLGMAYRTRSRKYVAGAGTIVLAAQSMFGSGLIERTKPVFERIMKHGYTTAFGVLWGDIVSYLFHGGPNMPVTQGYGHLGMYPSVRSSLGIVLLAARPDDEIRDIIAGAQRHDTQVSDVERNIAFAREHGYSSVPSQQRTRSIAVIAGDPPYGALACSHVPQSDVKRMVPLLKEAGDTLARLLTAETV